MRRERAPLPAHLKLRGSAWWGGRGRDGAVPVGPLIGSANVYVTTSRFEPSLGEVCRVLALGGH